MICLLEVHGESPVFNPTGKPKEAEEVLSSK